MFGSKTILAELDHTKDLSLPILVWLGRSCALTLYSLCGDSFSAISNLHNTELLLCGDRNPLQLSEARLFHPLASASAHIVPPTGISISSHCSTQWHHSVPLSGIGIRISSLSHSDDTVFLYCRCSIFAPKKTQNKSLTKCSDLAGIFRSKTKMLKKFSDLWNFSAFLTF